MKAPHCVHTIMNNLKWTKLGINAKETGVLSYSNVYKERRKKIMKIIDVYIKSQGKPTTAVFKW